MIITRIADTVEFQLSETRRIAIDVGRLIGASLAIGRTDDGRLAPALELNSGNAQAPARIVAGLEHLAIMHARIIEMMLELPPPRIQAAGSSYLPGEDFPD